jgi:hypothetical protein
MAANVALVRKIVLGTTAEQTEQGKSQTLRYLVQLSSINTLPAVLIDADDGTTRIPAYRSEDSSDTTRILLRKNVQCPDENAPLHWWVDCTYSVPPAAQFDIELPPVGSNGKWDITLACSGIETTEPSDFDIDGKIIQSSSREVVDPGVSRVIYDEQILIGFKTRTLNGPLIAAVRGSVNSGSVTLNMPRYGYARTFPAKTLKLGNIAYTTELDANGLNFFQVTLPLMFRSTFIKAKGDDSAQEHGWDRLVQDRGFYHIVADAQSRIIDGDGTSKVMPTFLDGNGGILPVGSDAVLLPFVLEPRLNFVSLLAGIA